MATTIYPDPWEDPTSRSTLRSCNLHCRCIRVQNWRFYVLDPPSGLRPVRRHTYIHQIQMKPWLTLSRSNALRIRSLDPGSCQPSSELLIQSLDNGHPVDSPLDSWQGENPTRRATPKILDPTSIGPNCCQQD